MELDAPDEQRGVPATLGGARPSPVPGSSSETGRGAVALTLEQLGGWPYVLGRLSSGTDLTSDEAAAGLTDVLEGNATPSQLAAFIFGLRCKGETVEEMTGLVRAMIGAAEIVPMADDQRARLVDTCGTGGDRSGSANISTRSAEPPAG